MKNRIIEICELGQPQSIIHRENEPITELIKTEALIKELNEAINYTHSCKSDSEQLTKRKRECECSGMSYKVKCGFKCHK